MTAEQLRQGWSPRRVGRRILVLPETTSTNTVVLDAVGRSREGDDSLSSNAENRPGGSRSHTGWGTGSRVAGPGVADVDGLAVLADYQTAGRGRQGCTWWSPRGASVLCSVLLIQGGEQVGGWLTLAAAVAACDAVRRATAVTPSIKWPNDLRISGRKLGGILIESQQVRRDDPPVEAEPGNGGRRAWAIGIGINCLQHGGHFPPDLRDGATSLELETSHPIDRTAVARELLRCLDAWLGDPGRAGDEAVHAAWMSYAEPIGQRVRLRCRGREYTGRTVAVDPSGGLIVQADGGRQEWFDPMLTTLL